MLNTLDAAQSGNANLDMQIPRILSDIEIKAVKIKIKKLITHLVECHLSKGGMYFESSDAELYPGAAPVIKLSSSQAKTIASLIAPYLVWVTSQYVSKFYKLSPQNFCTFTKTTTSSLPNFYHLDYSVTSLTQNNLSIVMMFMVVAFEDHFASTELNKVVLNRLSYLVN